MSNQVERALDPEEGGERRQNYMIVGEKVILRALEREDAERCFRWMNDPQIVRTLKARYPMPLDEEYDWVEKATRRSASERHFAIERKDNRSHIGNASLHEIDWVSRNCRFGLFVGEPSAWNSGFGSDAIAALVRFAFEEMNLMKLRIRVFDYNERARHVLAALGFEQEGVLKREFYREGKYHDLVLLSKFREE